MAGHGNSKAPSEQAGECRNITTTVDCMDYSEKKHVRSPSMGGDPPQKCSVRNSSNSKAYGVIGGNMSAIGMFAQPKPMR